MTPINLKEYEVKALLDNTLFRVRRPVTLLLGHNNGGKWNLVQETEEGFVFRDAIGPSIPVKPPFGRVGDLIRVRETWAQKVGEYKFAVAYKADGVGGSCGQYGGEYEFYPHTYIVGVADKEKLGHWVGRGYYGPWKSPITMPEWASRFTLRITGLCVERVQDVDNGSAMLCGACKSEYWNPSELDSRPFEECWHDDCFFWEHYPLEIYKRQWYADYRYTAPWGLNDLVWRYDFELARKGRAA